MLAVRNASLVGTTAAYNNPRISARHLPVRFLKAVGDAQYKVLRHHHAEDPYPIGRFRRAVVSSEKTKLERMTCRFSIHDVMSAAITIQKLLEGLLARCDK
jgi:hypothetical protein